MKLLILGGTVFLGRHLAEQALARGWETTLLHRGKHGRDLFPEARRLLAVLGDTLGERERLVREVLKLLDMERRIRLDDLRLQVDALISSEWLEMQTGMPRKYYHLTPKGRETLIGMKQAWRRFSLSVDGLLEKS